MSQPKNAGNCPICGEPRIWGHNPPNPFPVPFCTACHKAAFTERMNEIEIKPADDATLELFGIHPPKFRNNP